MNLANKKKRGYNKRHHRQRIIVEHTIFRIKKLVLRRTNRGED
ncbi:MAG: hypothetical protein ACM3VV_06780 [Deltaproteobacteria bacterium]